MLRRNDFEVLIFDCYGTLIDWETGILKSLRPIFAAHRIELIPDSVLELYGELESAAERGAYRECRYPRAYARGTLDQNPKSNWSFNCPLWTLSWNST